LINADLSFRALRSTQLEIHWQAFRNKLGNFDKTKVESMIFRMKQRCWKLARKTKMQ